MVKGCSSSQETPGGRPRAQRDSWTTEPNIATVSGYHLDITVDRTETGAGNFRGVMCLAREALRLLG